MRTLTMLSLLATALTLTPACDQGDDDTDTELDCAGKGIVEAVHSCGEQRLVLARVLSEDCPDHDSSGIPSDEDCESDLGDDAFKCESNYDTLLCRQALQERATCDELEQLDVQKYSCHYIY